MLLQSLIQNQQAVYAQIQSQIEELQAQQREIQAYLQQLGSVESQMVSAAQMVAEAVNSIRQFCPDELENYQTTINGLFGDAPIAQLVASEDENDCQQPEVHPEPSADTIEVDSIAIETVSDKISEAQVKRLWAIAKNELHLGDDDVRSVYESYGIASSKDIPVSLYDEVIDKLRQIVKPSNGNDNGHSKDPDFSMLLTVEELKKCDRPTLIKLANVHKISNYMNKTRDKLAEALTGTVTQNDLDNLMAASKK